LGGWLGLHPVAALHAKRFVHSFDPHPTPTFAAGPLKSLTARFCDCARVQFGGEKPDTYFGGYVDDLKSGPGVYVFATGAFYVGEYKVCERVDWWWWAGWVAASACIWMCLLAVMLAATKECLIKQSHADPPGPCLELSLCHPCNCWCRLGSGRARASCSCLMEGCMRGSLPLTASMGKGSTGEEVGPGGTTLTISHRSRCGLSMYGIRSSLETACSMHSNV
jgi:hypothetical protein